MPHCCERARSGRCLGFLLNKSPPPPTVQLFLLPIARHRPHARTFCAGTLARAKTHPLGVWGKIWARLARGQCAQCPGIAAVCAGAFSGAECPFPEKCAVLALPDARPLPEVGAQNVRGAFLTPRAPCKWTRHSPHIRPSSWGLRDCRFDPPLFLLCKIKVGIQMESPRASLQGETRSKRLHAKPI